MANKAVYKELLPLHRNESGRDEQAQLEIETDKSSGNLKSGAMVCWLGEDGLKSHAYSISQFGKGDFAEVITNAPCARVTQKLIDTAHAAAMTKLNAIRERAIAWYAAKPIVVTNAGLQWLVLPDESMTTYTNWGDGREGDASELVEKVNSDETLGMGRSDWRLPTVDELKSLSGTQHAPKNGWFWSSPQFKGNSNGAWYVDFNDGYVGNGNRGYGYHVRLVRASQ